MFFREKKSGPRSYLQIVENRWEEGGSKQRVIATLGRVDELRKTGQLDALLQSGARFAEASLLLSAHQRDELVRATTQRVGPALVFERLWGETGCQKVIGSLLRERRFGFRVERALFLTVLHRLFDPGSDRQADRWRADYAISEVEDLSLHQLYRAMAWLGGVLPEHAQEGKTPFAPRCTKDLIEEHLFAHRRDLFSSLDVVFFDTTSIYFEGEGGTTIGRRGNSKDSRPDLKQMVVGLVLDGEGRPICCELWSGNTTDVKRLVPIVERLRTRFQIGTICVVADRGMISEETINELDERRWFYILGARMRSTAEVSDEVLSRAGRFHVVNPKGKTSKDPSPLKVKEVWIWDRRYIICENEDQKKKDAADREAILEGLRKQLQKGDKSLVGNNGYRKFLKAQGESFQIDEAKAKVDARYDGKWVLRTNTVLTPAEVALKYKQLWMVEELFRTTKSLLETRPIFHKRDETIRGHVFCSFLALILRKELQDRLVAKGHEVEWADVIRGLERLQEVEVTQGEKKFVIRTEATGTCGKVFQAAGVAMPSTVRQLPSAPTTTPVEEAPP